MSVAVAEQLPDAETDIRPTTEFIDANERLDPSGQLRLNARDIANNRLRHAGQEPKTDVLGAARLLLAAEVGGVSDSSYLTELNANLEDELRKEVIEAVRPSRQLTVNRVRIGEDCRARLGGLELVPMFARGIHPANKPWYNRLSELNVTEELLSEQHFKDPKLRDSHILIYVSPVPNDEEPRYRQLFKHGFRPDTGKWKLRSHSYVKVDGVWHRVTEELSMSGSNIKLFRQLYKELKVDLPQPGTARRMGAMALRKMRVPRLWRAHDAPSTQVLATPMLVSKSVCPQGVVNVAQMADALQAQHLGTWRFCGDIAGEEPKQADYNKLAADSALLEAEITGQIKQLAAVAKTIVRSSASFEYQTQLFNNKKIEMLRDLCARRPDLALHAFGAEAHGLYKQAGQLRSQNLHDQADSMLKKAHEKSNKTITCGLELVAKQAITLEELRGFPDLYLIAKYGITEAIKVGRCTLCGRHGWIGRCGPGGSGFCGGCDAKDSNKDGSSNGYIASVMRSRARVAARVDTLNTLVGKTRRTN